MKLHSTLQRAGLALVAVLGAASSLQAAAQATAPLPPERQAGVASFVSGGIADGESKRFEAAFDRYPLVIQLFEHGDAQLGGNGRDVYTADAQVTIVNSKNAVVFDERAEGPFMLVRLPAGDYRITARLGSVSLPAQSVHVTDSGHARSVFVFPAKAG